MQCCIWFSSLFAIVFSILGMGKVSKCLELEGKRMFVPFVRKFFFLEEGVCLKETGELQDNVVISNSSNIGRDAVNIEINRKPA